MSQNLSTAREKSRHIANLLVELGELFVALCKSSASIKGELVISSDEIMQKDNALYFKQIVDTSDAFSIKYDLIKQLIRDLPQSEDFHYYDDLEQFCADVDSKLKNEHILALVEYSRQFDSSDMTKLYVKSLEVLGIGQLETEIILPSETSDHSLN